MFTLRRETPWPPSSLVPTDEAVSKEQFRILAIVPHEGDRGLIRRVARGLRTHLSFQDLPPSTRSLSRGGTPHVIIYDSELTPHHWLNIVRRLANSSPQPYVIVLAPMPIPELSDHIRSAEVVSAPITYEAMTVAIRRVSEFVCKSTSDR